MYLAYIDVTGSVRMLVYGQQIADKNRQRFKSEIGLTSSVGVSWNKVFANWVAI
ncbi:MAG: hypothetical protein ABFC57_04980 [Veillonellales bacterium]